MKARLKFDNQLEDAIYKNAKAKWWENYKNCEKEVNAVFLLGLHLVFKFGKKRIKRYFRKVHEEMKRLELEYQAEKGDCGTIAIRELKRLGVDMDELFKDLK